MKYQSKARSGVRLAVACIGLAAALSTGAQTTTPSTTGTGTTGMTTTSSDRRDDGFNWGWLGLLGLAGLAGLRRRDDVSERNRIATAPR